MFFAEFGLWLLAVFAVVMAAILASDLVRDRTLTASDRIAYAAVVVLTLAGAVFFAAAAASIR